MTEITEKALDAFPPAYIILMLMSGAIFLELSPLRLIPNLIINLFTNNNSADILASFAVIALCSFIIGIVFFLLDTHILGNRGLNRYVRFYYRSLMHKIFPKNFDEEKPIEKESETTIQDVKFAHWLKEKGYESYFNFFVIRDFVVRGFLLGFEVTFLVNLGFFLELIYLRLLFLPVSWVSGIITNFLVLEVFGLLVVTAFLFGIVLVYQAKIWKPNYKKQLEPLYKELELEQKRLVKKNQKQLN